MLPFDATIQGAKGNLQETPAPKATQVKCKDSGAVGIAGGKVWSERDTEHGPAAVSSGAGSAPLDGAVRALRL
jgi:hypothetical protein